jgi:subtilisin family serine protease
MSNVFSLLPGQLDVTFVVGDEVNVAINLGNVNITGYTLQSAVYVASTGGFQGGGGGTVSTVGATAATPTIQVVTASTGAIIWSLNETQTAALTPAIKYLWYLRWITPSTTMTRTILAGACIPRAPGS